MSALRATAIAGVLVALASSRAAAQSDPATTLTIRAECPTALPSDLVPALELELGGGARAESTDPAVVVTVITPCARAATDLDIIVETSSGARLGPLHLDIAELGPRIRGRVAALWIAEHVRIAGGEVEPPAERPAAAASPPPVAPVVARIDRSSSLGAPAIPPSSVPAATPNERARGLVRASLAFSFGYDAIAGGIGPGADLRLELGARGRPGGALELGIGGAGMTTTGIDTWTELRASLGGLFDVVIDEVWTTALGARLLFVHEVFTGESPAPGAVSQYRISDPLDVRAAAFATGRLYVHRGLSVLAEIELGFHLFSFFPDAYVEGRTQNLVQGALRVGVGID